mmetsp:Transcript_5609/g.15208  ORF Transcript_5609/g.15208 Transcript_5609/m.15208 type:complete len:253 (+) Transcript_5609:1194-1952(+)
MGYSNAWYAYMYGDVAPVCALLDVFIIPLPPKDGRVRYSHGLHSHPHGTNIFDEGGISLRLLCRSATSVKILARWDLCPVGPHSHDHLTPTTDPIIADIAIHHCCHDHVVEEDHDASRCYRHGCPVSWQYRGGGGIQCSYDQLPHRNNTKPEGFVHANSATIIDGIPQVGCPPTLATQRVDAQNSRVVAIVPRVILRQTQERRYEQHVAIAIQAESARPPRAKGSAECANVRGGDCRNIGGGAATRTGIDER